MSFEDNVKTSFQKAKEDMEGIKNELAFALRRIAKIEEVFNRQALREISDSFNTKSPSKKSSKKKR
jgi:hypothetical protein